LPDNGGTPGAVVYAISVGDLLAGSTATKFTVAAIGRLSLAGTNDPLAFQLKAYPVNTTLKVIEIGNGLPSASYKLSQNYPNPFNPSTTINYQISQAGNVSLKVYDVLGREVATLVNQKQNAGSYQVQFNASRLSSGVYFYKLQAGNFAESRKLTLVK
ncbi:MAG: T9SS type A sorting domain-containing protein, partial [Rhizobacter sp.]|nr:T9SS type A sorting domain-containing protein [Chlorobiales bacterium]